MAAHSHWRLDGHSALITGAARGIGLAIAQELLSLGASVTGVDREPNSSLGFPLIAADLATPEGRDRIVHAAPPQLDILVNNAGLNIRKPTLEYTDDEYSLIFATNLDAAFALSRLLHPRLAASGNASIINIASVAGLSSVGSSAAYASSKAALAHLSRYLAVEWAKDKIRVNAVAPGWVRTGLTTRIQETPAAMQLIADRTPLGRIAEPEEIARVAAFLAMPAASYLTGAILPVDGAMTSYAMDITSAL